MQPWSSPKSTGSFRRNGGFFPIQDAGGNLDPRLTWIHTSDTSSGVGDFLFWGGWWLKLVVHHKTQMYTLYIYCIYNIDYIYISFKYCINIIYKYNRILNGILDGYDGVTWDIKMGYSTHFLSGQQVWGVESTSNSWGDLVLQHYCSILSPGCRARNDTLDGLHN